jgi:hypothetical protein
LKHETILIQEYLLDLISRIIEDHDTALFRDLADSAIALEVLIRIEGFRPYAYEFCGRTVEMNECESIFTGDDSVLPVQEKNFFIGKHVEGTKGRGRAR